MYHQKHKNDFSMYQTVLSFGIANPSNPAALTATVAQSFISKFIAAIDCAGVSANEDMELELAANINSLPVSEEVKESALAAILYFDQFGFGKKQTAKTQAHCAAIDALLCAVYKAEYHNEVAEQQNQPSELPAENMQETEQKADFSLPICNLFAAAPYNPALSNNTKTNFYSILAPADEKRYGQKRPFVEKDGYSQMINTSDAAGLIDCKKCKDCGHSFIPPAPADHSDLLGDYPADLPPTSPEKPLTQRGYIEQASGYVEILAALHREGCADKGRLGWLISEVFASLHKAKYAETPPVHLSLSVAFIETRKTPSTTYYRYTAKSELVKMWAGSELIATEFSGIVKVQTVFGADGNAFVETTEYKHATTLNGQTVEVLELRDTDGSLYEPQRLIDEVLERAKRMFV